ncbi:hypothetical protein ACQR5T_21065 [Xanthomonas oryzae pv. oryzicola]|uniref:hypothetical protein n=1 Tax=Xanthomonas oryzae TaxID=347 RepID=UPI0004639464|nr:hypothetical protein ACU16_13195 [Xanthomonas oryzae pv. oryzicola]AKO08816.1 hypothetical protein ACU17_13015 [Xanthomonas oryzae pv. oryzicola]
MTYLVFRFARKFAAVASLSVLFALLVIVAFVSLQLNLKNDQIRDFLKPDNSGFRAEIYLPDPAVLGPGYKPTIAFKGSAGQVLTPHGLRDTTSEDFIANNFPQSVGLKTDYSDRAIGLAYHLQPRTWHRRRARSRLGTRATCRRRARAFAAS